MRFDLVLLVRPSIGEALAFGARRREFCAHQIGVTKGRAGVVAEVKFREIAMQVLLFAMLVHTLHAALRADPGSS